MSTDTERLEEGTEGERSRSVLETWESWYHLPVLGVVMLFMFWTRMRSYDNFTTEDGTPALAAVDSWYHWRTVQWTSENYPQTMPFEIWTSFPSGRYVGQFGTLFDQLIVTAAMVVGLGDPSTELLYTVSLVAIPVLGALVALPVFAIGRRLGGTLGGLVSVLLLALAPGTFFFRSTTGQLQHHVAEVLFMALSVLAMMVALRVAEQEKPIYELLVTNELDALKKPALFSVLAGISISLYIWVWPPGVVFVGILAAFFTVHLSLEYFRGTSPDHVAFVGVTSLGTTGLFTIALIELPTMNATSFGFLQPATAFLVAFGCVFMAWLARQWDRHEVPRTYYPVTIVGLITVAFVVMALATPDLFSSIARNVTSRLLPLDPGTGTATIAEAQPPDSYPQHVFDEFGMAFYTFLAGLALLLARPWLGREFRAEHTLIVVWSLFLISMSTTQTRFAYYLVLAVAVVNAVFISDVVRYLDLERNVEAIRNVETYQVIAVFLVVVMLFAPLLPPVAAAPVWDRGANMHPSDDAMAWEEANHWLLENTPEVGDWAGADNASELEYYGTYEYPEDGTFDYPVGAYGVLSWWDYGHLITVQGERIPHSNPFQSNAASSAAYLTATSEERAELILDAIAEGGSVSDQTDDQLRDAIGDGGSHEEIRYVMIDHKMAGGKFGAITQWTGPDYESYVEDGQYTFGEEPLTLPGPNEQYEETMLASLYLDDATGLEHYRLVHETDDYAAVTSMLTATQQGFLPNPLQSFRLEQLSGTNGTWSGDAAEISTQYDLVRQAQQLSPVSQSEYIYNPQVVSSVKTFERVEGATLTGSVDAVEDATAYAVVELETAPGRTFVYIQEAEVEDDGSFELTVPYATDDELGVEDGYTDSSVEALSAYEVAVATPDENGMLELHYSGETEVPETAVIDGETIDVTLEETDETVDDPTEEETDAPEEVGPVEPTPDEDAVGDAEGEAGEAEPAGALTPLAG
ncbi:oligosaccharyl transferase, archaeosortase A system-associated [Natronobiforma cellulositropha]|uniref:oligosaccharyl transferase, archaeosortase A system-associated n=1 Tax=Natronobiforma cellulositropha TaxID=1679076 RepID=UPI0021D5A9FC|nr:oligosaccharyl transferase, archaeosortase A system-associated [Natronobiforma cellulositropha]